MEATEKSKVLRIVSAVRGDLLPSVAVFLVALPLCMGIAIASGVPVAAGLITGIVGGLVVGVLAGAPLQVSGPAAGLTVVVYDIVQQYGLESLGVIVLMAGVLQILAGMFRLGQWFRAVSPAVIKGMLAGIGVLIFASQFHVMVDDKPKENGLQNLITIPRSRGQGPAATGAKHRGTTHPANGLLEEIGTLHERQTEVQEAIAKPCRKRWTRPMQSRRRCRCGRWRCRSRLCRSCVIQPSEVRKNHFAKADTKEVAEAADAALAQSEAALASLHSMDVRTWLASQQQAAESLAAARRHTQEPRVGRQGGNCNHRGSADYGRVFAPGGCGQCPAPLVAIVAATALTLVWSLPVLCVEVPDSLLSAVHLPSTAVLENNTIGGLLGGALVVALIASAETLLCATAVDQMHSGRRTQYDRELMAQGVGNSVCGVLGALPMTGVIVRSATNVQAGGTTRASAILHGVWLLVFVGRWALCCG